MYEYNIIERIKELCQIRGWTYYQLAKESGIPYSTLSTMLHKANVPSVPTIIKICNGFHISITQFFSPEDDIAKLSKEQQECLQLWNELDETSQSLAFAYMLGLRDRQRLQPEIRSQSDAQYS